MIANDIKSAISKLSPKYKKVFELYHIQNYSHDEIADELGINVGTSKSNLFKAKLKLSEMLKHYNNNFN
jgi:RNA polymerase sigma-70 factor (ECF subfamily)